MTTTTSTDDLFAHDTILPPDPLDDGDGDLEPLHDREYRVRAFRKADDRVLIRGAIRDQKPPGLYIPGDPDPLTVHHMQIDIEVAYPSMEIVAARVGMETHPHRQCTRIEPHYDGLVGLSIARGFTHRVRELFGGPRGCTHTTALLQAMAPVAIQCIYAMRASLARRAEAGEDVGSPGGVNSQQREAMWRFNLNTCHVWAEDSDVVADLLAGGESEPPLFVEERMVRLGMKPEDWRRTMGD